MASSGRHAAGQASPQPVSCGSAASLSVSDASELQLELDDGQLQRMQAAVEALLVGLGEDVQRQGLRNTPKVRSITTTAPAARSASRAATCILVATVYAPAVPPRRSARRCVPPHPPTEQVRAAMCREWQRRGWTSWLGTISMLTSEPSATSLRHSRINAASNCRAHANESAT